jgi:hypothetical protein
VRLEAIATEANRDRALRAWQRVRTDLDDTQEAGTWIGAAHTLAERGTISDDALCYFVEILLESVTLSATSEDPELVRIEDAMRAVESAHGLAEDEFWYLDEAPPEWVALNDQWDARTNAVAIAFLRTLGHARLADLREQDPDEFEAKCDVGGDELWGDPGE